MPHRHFGIPLRTKRRPTYTGPGPAGALSGSAFVGAILVILMAGCRPVRGEQDCRRR
jgi:hypothetical protein